KCSYRLFDRCPFLLTTSVFRWTCLQTSFVPIRARIPYVLLAICLRKEEPQADTACRFSICCIKALGLRNSDSQVDNVSEWSIRVLRVGRRRLHDVEEIPILIDQRLTVGIKVRRRNSEFIFRSWVSNLRLQTETGLSRSF